MPDATGEGFSVRGLSVRGLTPSPTADADLDRYIAEVENRKGRRIGFRIPPEPYVVWTDEAIASLVGREADATMFTEPIGRYRITSAVRCTDAIGGLWVTGELIPAPPSWSFTMGKVSPDLIRLLMGKPARRRKRPKGVRP